MAKISPEDHDGFTGILGPLTVSRWKDKIVVKARQQGPSKKKTEAQKQASRKFALLTRFATVAKAYLKVGFQGTSKSNAQHAFISANMKHGIGGTWPDYKIAFDQLVVSEGTLTLPEALCCRAEEGRIVLTWTPRRGRATETLMVMVFHVEREEAVVTEAAATITDGSARIALPYAWKGDAAAAEVAVFACVADGHEVSRSVHFGPLAVVFGEQDEGDFARTIYTTNQKVRRKRKRKMDDDWEPSDADRQHVAKVSGVLGPLIVYDNMGKHCLRSRYTIKKAPTPAKQRANERFGNLTRMLRQLNDFLKVGLQRYATQMTQLNAAIKLNYKHAYATVGEGTQPDYKVLRLSEGPLPHPKDLTAERTSTGIRIRWQADGGQAGDRLMVALYHEALGEATTDLDVAKRGDAVAVLQTPTTWQQGGPIHLYAAFASAHDESVSDSVYFQVL